MVELIMCFIEISRFTIILSFVSGAMCRRETFSLCPLLQKEDVVPIEVCFRGKSMGVKNVGTRVRPPRLKSLGPANSFVT